MSIQNSNNKFSDLFSVLYYGSLYYPAWKHYGRPINVVCNYCGMQNLKISIGYLEMDLCLVCATNLLPITSTGSELTNISASNALDVIKNGNIFCPAWKHYNNNNLEVLCDNCKSSNLNIAIGYLGIDLCLKCVSYMNNLL